MKLPAVGEDVTGVDGWTEIVSHPALVVASPISDLTILLPPSTDDVEVFQREVQRRLFEVSEVKLNSVQVLPLTEVLDLLGMETQLKEKRIVDLRPSAGTPSTEKSVR